MDKTSENAVQSYCYIVIWVYDKVDTEIESRSEKLTAISEWLKSNTNFKSVVVVNLSRNSFYCILQKYWFLTGGLDFHPGYCEKQWAWNAEWWLLMLLQSLTGNARRPPSCAGKCEACGLKYKGAWDFREFWSMVLVFTSNPVDERRICFTNLEKFK